MFIGNPDVDNIVDAILGLFLDNAAIRPSHRSFLTDMWVNIGLFRLDPWFSTYGSPENSFGLLVFFLWTTTKSEIWRKQ